MPRKPRVPSKRATGASRANLRTLEVVRLPEKAGALVEGDAFEMPDVLSGLAADRWFQLEPRLREDGRLTAETLPTLVAYCLSWGTMCDAQERVAAEGLTVERRDGVAKHPLLLVRQQAMGELRAWGALLGLDAVSAARLRVAPEATDWFSSSAANPRKDGA